MKTTIFGSLQFLMLVTLVGLFLQAPTAAQEDFGAGTDLFPNFSLNGFGGDEEPVEWKSRYFADPDGEGRIEVEASLAPTWHIYSTTQKSGGPIRTKISITAPNTVQVTGDFTPDHAPAKGISSLYDGLTVEEHDGVVVWSAPAALPSGFEAPITVMVSGLVCKSGGDNRCMPVDEELTATYSGSLAASTGSFKGGDADQQLAAEAKSTEAKNQAKSTEAKNTEAKNTVKPFRDGEYVVEWTAEVAEKHLTPGQQTILKFSAKPDASFHVYKSATDDADSSTNFVVTKKDGLLLGEPVADKPIITKSILPTLPPTSYYLGKVTWSLPVEVPADATPGEKTIEGMIAYQACTDNSCHRPTALKFTTQVVVGETPSQEPATVEMVSAKAATALDAAATANWVDPIEFKAAAQPASEPKPSAPPGPGVGPQAERAGEGAAVTPTSSKSSSFPALLGLAMLGGLILNVMPCVLPVVGLKIMGFVSQAGEDRGRVFVLNLVYVLGILSVFAIFAVVAAVSTFGWGEQFTYFPVKLGLTLLMFALALSYLGVWEIPVPGMAAGSASQELQNREGLAGAFSKGAFATILATPCSGPLLGYILGLTLGLSAFHTIAIFMSVGLGMSLPYLIIGIQPKLIAWLPKPGAWMETLKQLMAFLFLGTVAFFFAQFNEEQKVPVFVSLIGVWFGCWIIGQVPNWAAIEKRLLAWGTGIAAAALIGVWSFNYLKPDYKLAWEDYSEPRLQQLQNEGRTVMVDFGAKWCGTCIYNYEVAINTEQTRQVVDELDAVAMYADWTDHNQEIKEKLAELNSRSIPLLAIYPAGRPDEPIILRDLVTQQDVIDALRRAGASKSSASSSRPANVVASTRR